MMRIGIGSWTLPWAIGFRMNPYKYPLMSPQELIDYAAANGIHLVQLYNNLDLLAFDTSDLSEIKKHADKHQIDLEIGGMSIDAEYLRELLQVADVLASRTIRTVITPAGAGGGRYEVNAVVEMIRSFISDFEDTGRTLLIENHDRYTSVEFRTILEAVNSEAVGICFDTANSIGKLEHFRESFSILSDFIYSCHYKEYCIKRVQTNLGFIIEGCCPGEGENIAEEFFGLIRSLDRDIDVVLEQWVPFQGSIQDTLRIEKQWADKGIQILKSFSNMENIKGS